MTIYIENSCTNPEKNLKFEKSLCSFYKHSSFLIFNPSLIFMLWRNEPSVIIGRFGNIENEINIDFANSNNIKIVRRNSGGGSVYHDLGNVNYSFILRDDEKFTLKFFSDIIIKSLNSIGLNAELTFTHNDIKANNLKISGSAQYHHDGIILHHGTLLFDSDLSVIPKVLKNSGQVTNIKPLLKNDMNIYDFMNAVKNFMMNYNFAWE